MNDKEFFKCLNCGEIIKDNPLGTKHRNHCPKCLYSKHLDQDTPGDRGSNCFGLMEPIALAFKDYKIDPYSKKQTGQLMIVHLCKSCGKIGANRIAGDDLEDQIIKLFDKTFDLKPENLSQLEQLHIKVLTKDDKNEMLNQLYGGNHSKSSSEL